MLAKAQELRGTGQQWHRLFNFIDRQSDCRRDWLQSLQRWRGSASSSWSFSEPRACRYSNAAARFLLCSPTPSFFSARCAYVTSTLRSCQHSSHRSRISALAARSTCHSCWLGSTAGPPSTEETPIAKSVCVCDPCFALFVRSQPRRYHVRVSCVRVCAPFVPASPAALRHALGT